MKRLLSLFRKDRGHNPATGSADGPPADPGMEQLLSSTFQKTRDASPDTERQWARLESAITREETSGRIVPPSRARMVPVWAAPAAIAIIAAVLLLFNLFPDNPTAPLHFVTARGERSSIQLPDGSEVTLNHTSTLDFDPESFTASRKVSLSGEAYFSIRHSDVPFVVTTAAGSVTVTGTKFNVRVREGRYEVGVTEGSVRAMVATQSRDTAIAVTAGHALIGHSDTRPMPVRKILQSNYPGWTERTLIFTSMDLSLVCDELMNTFDAHIVLDDPSLGNEIISGAFDARDIRNVLSAICSITDSRYRYEDGTYILF